MNSRPPLSTRRWIAALLAFALLCFHAIALAQQPVTSRPVPASEAGTLLGRGVTDSAGTDVGLLVDVLADKDGKPLAGVINVGGFLGVGMRRVAVAWRLLRFSHAVGDTRIVMDLTLDEAAAAPEMSGPANTLIVVDRPAQ
ncbi:MAG: PRC-barrel domain containing protein [Acetobacteraceae bacterium]|nr:PRC-barrel domain containing protein [Acetobacteraceae bacterium]